MKKNPIISSLFTLVILGILYTTFSSSSGGISNVSTSGCTCHGATASSSTIVTVTSNTNSYYQLPGDSILFTVTVASTNPAMIRAGFNLTSNIGVIGTVGAGVNRVSNTQIRHNAPKNFTSGSASWTFWWRPPATGSTALQFNIAGNAVNGNGSTSGDQWNFGTIAPIPLGTTLALKNLIQGYHTGGGTMVTVLENQGLTVPPNSSDSMTVEIRNSTSTSTVQFSKKVLANTSGNSSVRIGAITGSRYLVVKNRNALETWSASPINFTAPNTSYDFTTAANKAFGSNQIQLASGIFAFYSGDIDQNGYLELDDYNIWDIEFQAGFPYSNYTPDLDGNGYVELDDYNIWDVNFQNGLFYMSP